MAVVKKQGRYGLVNRTGEEAVSVTFDSLHRTNTGKFVVVKDQKQGLADKNGKTLIHPKYDKVTDLANGYVLIERNGKHGLLTANGISTIPLLYDSLFFNKFNNTYFAADEPNWQKVELGTISQLNSKKSK